MKIEITDRNYFQTQCQKAITNIRKARAAEVEKVQLSLDEATEKWRNKHSWLKGYRKDKPHPDTEDWWWRNYIARYTGSTAEENATKALSLLHSKGTGAIILEQEEWQSIANWA